MTGSDHLADHRAGHPADRPADRLALRLAVHLVAWSIVALAGVLMWRFGAVDAFLASAIAFCG